MADTTVILNGKSYRLARRGANPAGNEGALAWDIGGVPAQPVDPSLPLSVMEWQVGGPNLNSFEVIPPGGEAGFLGVDYGVDTDSRWGDDFNTLGPAITVVDLSGTGGTAAPVSCWSPTGAMNAAKPFLVGRGNAWAKVNPSSLVRMAQATEATVVLAENITSLLYTKSAAGTEEVSVGMRATAHEVITAIGNAGADDTHAAAVQIASHFLQGPDRVFGARDAGAANAATLLGNVLTGSVTMASPAWAVNASLPGLNVKVNGLAMDGNFVVVGTSAGPYTLDPLYNQFRPLSRQSGADALNCSVMAEWEIFGLIYNLRYGARVLSWGESASIGPEIYRNNTSPVRGRLTGGAGTDRWFFWAHYDDITDDTYLLAARPRLPGDPHPYPLSFYTLRRFADTKVNFLGNLDTLDGTLTLPTLIGGYGTDVFALKCGRTDRWPDDASYAYALSGTTYLTESRRQPGVMKDVVAYELETSGCNANQTVTVGASFDGATAATLTGTLVDGSGRAVNGVIKTNGWQRLLPVSNTNVPLTTHAGRRIKPQLTYATNTAAAAPAVTGKLRVLYRPRPLIAKTLTFTVILDREMRSGQSQREAKAQLLAEMGSAPVALEDPDGNALYVRVDGVSIAGVFDKGTHTNSGAGQVATATFHCWAWPTNAGQ